jgi:SulP family sulfate permease
MRGYQRAWVRTDVLAGLATGTVVIPQAMAYSTIAGLPVQVGLYTCMLPMLVYALLGGARALSVSTTSTIAVLVATTLAGLSARSDDDLLRSAYTLTFLVGVCLLGMRLLHLGAIVENISPATLAGIRIGVGLTVAASQLPALLGVSADPDAEGFFAKVADALGRIPDADGTTVAVAVVTLATLLVLHRFVPAVPGPLVVVAGGILLVAATDIEHHGLQLIDKVPTGLPTPYLPVFGDMVDLLPGALAIALMSFMETVLVARTNRRPSEPAIDSDQELLATAAAAMAGGLSQSLPPAGGFSQSAVNVRSGARTQVSGIVTAVLAVLVALFLAPLLDDLPRAVLAAMVMFAIVGLLSPAEFGRYARIDRTELWVALVVAFLGLTGGMLLGVAAGVVLTLFLVVRALNRPRVRPLYPRPQGGWTTNAPEVAAPPPSGPLLLKLDGALYTGNAQSTREAVVHAGRSADPPVSVVVVEGSSVRDVTVTMVDAIHSVYDDLARDGIELLLAEFPPATLEALRRSRWFTEVEPTLVCPTVEDCLERARSK